MFLDLPQAVGEAPGQHLPHGGVVVRPLDRADLEFAVVAALGPAVLVDHHGAHGFHAAGVGDIEGLDAPDAVQADEPAHLVHGSDGAQLLLLDALLILGEHQSRVSGRQLHQTLLLALLGHHDLHLLPPPFGEPAADDLLVHYRHLKPQLPGDKGGSCVKLLDKAVQNLPIVFRRGRLQMKMVPADQLALPDKEHLHHRVLLVPGHGNDVPVLPAAAGDLLFLGHLLYAV